MRGGAVVIWPFLSLVSTVMHFGGDNIQKNHAPSTTSALSTAEKPGTCHKYELDYPIQLRHTSGSQYPIMFSSARPFSSRQYQQTSILALLSSKYLASSSWRFRPWTAFSAIATGFSQLLFPAFSAKMPRRKLMMPLAGTPPRSSSSVKRSLKPSQGAMQAR